MLRGRHVDIASVLDTRPVQDLVAPARQYVHLHGGMCIVYIGDCCKQIGVALHSRWLLVVVCGVHSLWWGSRNRCTCTAQTMQRAGTMGANCCRCTAPQRQQQLCRHG
jgi:hypothetical protein